MPNTVRIKRRLAGGAAGAPATLENAELAFNEQDSTLYYGVGTGGAGGSASSILAIGGPGGFATLGTTQTISGNKTLSGVISLTGSGANSPTAVTQSVNDNTTRLATTAFVLGQGNSTAGTIAMNGTQAAGSSNLYARADHVHPSDTSRAPLASPTFTGVPAGPTAAVDTNTTQFATTAFVLAQAASANPSALGTAAPGTSTRYARADHVHVMPTLSQVGAATADVSFGGFKITNLATPTLDTDAATKAYVDAARTGLDVKASVRAASTANVTVTYSATGGTSARGQITAAPNTLDGVTLAANDRILLKNQSTGAQNGIWVVSTLGTGANGVWDRATDFDSDTEVTAGAFTFVAEGTANADSGWVLTTNDTITIGGASGTALAFAQFSGAGQVVAGAGLTKTGNTIDVASSGGGSLTIGADSINLTSGIATPGTYRSLTVDTYGRVTGGTAPTTFSGYGLSDTSANLAAAITDETGSGSLVFATSPTLVTPLLGTPTSGTLTNCTGLPISSGVSGLGTGVATFLGTPSSANLATALTDKTGTGVNVFATSPTLVTPLLGTPTSGTLTNCTGLPVSTGISGLGTNVATFLGTPSSSNLLAAVTDETGTGSLVFNTSPSLTTPALSGETFSTAAAVTAGTNAQGQGALTSDFNVVTTTAANPSGVTLPTATTGRRIKIVNKGTNPINIYPATGATIDALAANASISLAVNGVMEFNASSTTQWYSSFNTSVSGTGVSSFSAGTTGLTPSTGTTGAVTLAGILAATNGGTGVNNGTSTITLGGSLAFSGAFTTTFTVTGTTALTLPTSGTVLSDGSVIDGGTF